MKIDINIPSIALLMILETASRCDGSNRLANGEDLGSE
jgi:hypothetical protein